MNNVINMINKIFTISEGSGLPIVNNELKDIIKAIKSLENRQHLLEGSTEKDINQTGGFLGPLMRVALPLMKNVLISLAQNVLLSLGVIAVLLAIDAAIQKGNYRLGMTRLMILNEETKDKMGIVK